jgi:hypothetical protein
MQKSSLKLYYMSHVLNVEISRSSQKSMSAYLSTQAGFVDMKLFVCITNLI